MPTALEYRRYGWRWTPRWLETLHLNGRNDFSKALAACDGQWMTLADVARETGINRNSLKAYLRAGFQKRLLLRRPADGRRQTTAWGFQTRYEYRRLGS